MKKYSDCGFQTDLDLIEAIGGMLTEIAEEGNLTEQVLKRNTGFLLGILSLERERKLYANHAGLQNRA